MLHLWDSSYFTKQKPTYIKYVLCVNHYHEFFQIDVLNQHKEKILKYDLFVWMLLPAFHQF